MQPSACQRSLLAGVFGKRGIRIVIRFIFLHAGIGDLSCIPSPRWGTRGDQSICNNKGSYYPPPHLHRCSDGIKYSDVILSYGLRRARVFWASATPKQLPHRSKADRVGQNSTLCCNYVARRDPRCDCPHHPSRVRASPSTHADHFSKATQSPPSCP